MRTRDLASVTKRILIGTSAEKFISAQAEMVQETKSEIPLKEVSVQQIRCKPWHSILDEYHEIIAE